MTDRRVKEYIIGKDEVDEFVKTVQEWKFQKDWEKKGLIFNTETGISEDGTMHDGVYRQWINQPKKEQKMTREEAIQIVQKLLKTNRLDGTGLSQVWDFLKQPPTLADFLGWEEGQEYNWKGTTIKIEKNNIYEKNEKCLSNWCNFYVSGEELLDLRQAKKVEEPKYYAKIKGWEVFDEDDGYYWNYDEGDKWFYIGSKWGTERTKSQWAGLGVDEDNAEFKKVEVE